MLVNEGKYRIHPLLIRTDGSYISPRTMQHTSRIISTSIFAAFDFHSLRLTHATNLAEIGASDKYIQTRLGHTETKTTLKYEHVSDAIEADMRVRLNNFYEEKSDKELPEKN